MKLYRLLTPVWAALVILVVPELAHAQQNMGGPQGITTTDDPRRIPIPPQDTANDPVLVLRGGVLIDGTGSPPVANGVVVVRGDRILDAGSERDVTIPSNVEQTIDVSGFYVVPGLIDLHMHFTSQRGEDFALYRDSDAAAAIRGVEMLGLFLDGGITSVRDVGTRNDVALKLKEAVERRIFPGPRVFWSGKFVAARGGHGDESTGTATGRPKSLENHDHVRVSNGPDDWRLGVREQLRAGADLIKLTAPYSREEVAAAVDEAHAHGARVTADAFQDYVIWAVEANIDCIEHPLAIPDDAIRLMAEKGTALVPTITAFYNVLTYGYPSAGIPPGGFYFTTTRRFAVTQDRSIETVRKARLAGVKMGIGTDVPFEIEKRYPSDYFTELGFFEEAGFSDEEILACATRVGAEILDMADKLGTLERGKLADMLVVAENPLVDIQNLRKMRLVIADGRIVRDKRNNPGTSN